MSKGNRTKRLVAMCTLLTGNPGHQFSLAWFCQAFDLAKSTVSEDLAEVSQVIQETTGGKLVSTLGAGGGICYLPGLKKGEATELLSQLACRLSEPSRHLPGGFIYYSDILFQPETAASLGKIFATAFADAQATVILTLETKGIPLALYTAYWLGVPLAVARRSNKVTEGSSLSTNYLTGSGKRIETMFLSRHSIRETDRVLVIDDFMKAGGSAQGLVHLAKEFNAAVAGVGVMISTEHPQEKLVKDYLALLTLDSQLNLRVNWGKSQ